MPRNVTLIRPDGSTVQVKPDQVASLVSLGYREEGASENLDRLKVEGEKDYYTSTSQQVLAGLEGAASGLTVGASDLVFADEATSKRAAYNPDTRMYTEIAGAVLPAVFTGGTSVVAKTLAKTPAGMLAKGATNLGARHATSRAGQLAVAGAAEGAAFGAGGEVSRTSLSGDPLTIEGVLASGVVGGVIGGAAGLGGAGLERLGKGLRGPKPATIEEEFLDSISGRHATPGRTYGSADEIAAGPRPFPEPQVKSLARYPDARNPLDIRERMAADLIPVEKYEAFRRSVKELRQVGDKLTDQALEASGNLQAQFRKVADMGDELYARAMAIPAQSRGVKGASKAKGGHVVSKPNQGHLVSTPSTPGALDIERRTFAQDVRELRSAAQRALTAKTPLKAAEYVERYRGAVERLAKAFGSPAPSKYVHTAISSMDDLAHYKEAIDNLALPPDPAQLLSMGQKSAEDLFARVGFVLKAGIPEAKVVQETLGRAIDDLALAAGITAKAPPEAKLRMLWQSGREATKRAAADFEATGVRAGIKAGDEVHEGLAGGGQFGAADEFDLHRAVGDANKAGLSSTPIKVPIPKAKIVKDAGKRPGVVNKVAQYLANRAAYTAAAGIAGYHVGGPQWALIGALMAGKGAALGRLKGAAARSLEALGGAARKGVPRGYGLYTSLTGIPDPEGDLRSAFAKRSAELREASIAGRDRAFLFAEDLAAAGHPEFAKGVYDHTTKVLDILMGRLPKSPPGTRWGFENAWELPPEQAAVFAQEWTAGLDPVRFIEDMAADPTGVHPSAVTVLKEAWPQLFAEFRATMFVNISQSPKEYSESELRSLSILLEAQLTPTMNPEFVATQQAMFMRAQAKPAMGPPPGSGSRGQGPGGPEEATKAQILTGD